MAAKKKPQPPEPDPEPAPEQEWVVEIIETVEWEGIKIDACYRSLYCGAPHIELHVLEPALAPLPVTDTGYRSHFHHQLPADIEAAGGVTPFVKAWLDHEAKSPEWRKRQITGQQLQLF